MKPSKGVPNDAPLVSAQNVAAVETVEPGPVIARLTIKAAYQKDRLTLNAQDDLPGQITVQGMDSETLEAIRGLRRALSSDCVRRRNGKLIETNNDAIIYLFEQIATAYKAINL